MWSKTSLLLSIRIRNFLADTIITLKKKDGNGVRGSTRQVNKRNSASTARMSLLQLQLQMLSEALNSLLEFICIDSCT